MTDVNRGLADILADYGDVMSRIECPEPVAPESIADVPEPAGGPILKPADQQRSCTAPVFGLRA